MSTNADVDSGVLYCGLLLTIDQICIIRAVSTDIGYTSKAGGHRQTGLDLIKGEEIPTDKPSKWHHATQKNANPPSSFKVTEDSNTSWPESS